MDDSLIYSEDGKNVVGFCDDKVSSIAIPEGVKRIGNAAFKNHPSLKDVYFPKSLEVIDDNAFFNCVNIERICLGDNVRYLGKKCFGNCINLKGIFFPKNIKAIEKEAFYKCHNLEYIYLMSRDPNSIVIDADWLDSRLKNRCLLYVPLGTFNDYKRSSIFRSFDMDFNSRFTSELFMKLFPRYTSLSFFITLSELRNRWPLFIMDNLELEPDVILNGEKYYLKARINYIENDELFKNCLKLKCYTINDIRQKWTPGMIKVFLPKGVRVGRDYYYPIKDIERIEKSQSFSDFRRDPLRAIAEMIRTNADIVSKIDASFFDIPLIPKDKLIRQAYGEYIKRKSFPLSLKEFVDNTELCYNMIKAHLRHKYTNYDNLMNAFNRYDSDLADGDRGLLHEAINEAIYKVYPWLK